MIDPATHASILAAFDLDKAVYEDLAHTAAALIDLTVRESGLQLHSVTSRCKERSSLELKLRKPDKDYAGIADITDIAGIRVTTYFGEDVDQVADIIEREFTVDRDNSVDKRSLLDPDRFGYQSLHYVVQLNDHRIRLPEYARFNGRKFEIQVRSILQHAWAEIEHDLGYKSVAGVPKNVRRRFARVAGLLELADDEFREIRKELLEYASVVPDSIREQPEDVGIDKISLQALLASDSNVHRLGLAVAAAAGATLERTPDERLDRSLEDLSYLTIENIADLERVAAEKAEIVERYAAEWLGGKQYETMYDSIGLLYLLYVLLGERSDIDVIHSFLEKANLGSSDERHHLANRIIASYKRAVAS